MSLPLDQQQQPPPAYTGAATPGGGGGGDGSIGLVIGVLAVIATLGVVACVAGRLCSGRSILGYGRYDLHGWIERKCAACVGGRPDSARRQSAHGAGRTEEEKPAAGRPEITEAVAEP
ncbi:uncharacterized protein LOC122016779 [Zingiber officinale]|uniref:Uncharacterized protein n=1 Tax=Zingiber officinale TaxID=94328 RepID=A0A8J5KKL6_ZINOF|nr:uncharacterized protein LOC122016779 [Zingiber officinale]XP_042430112.1 uncharacterized protein LOC122016779 [Zingiber officinale]KAG6483152.1 hypothetical protein ZIOFF_059792 [Zingiber officinale]